MSFKSYCYFQKYTSGYFSHHSINFHSIFFCEIILIINMIVRPNATWFEKLFTLNGSIVPAIVPQMIFAAFVACVVSAVTLNFLPSETDDNFVEIAFTPFTALGVTIALALGFKNNASYDRWWEARKQWGKQIIGVRKLARIVEVAVGTETDTGRAVLLLAAAHSHAMRAMFRPNG